MSWAKIYDGGSATWTISSTKFYYCTDNYIYEVDLLASPVTETTIGQDSVGGSFISDGYGVFHSFASDNRVIHWKGQLYVAVGQYVSASYYIEVWRYTGTPGSWTRVFRDTTPHNNAPDVFYANADYLIVGSSGRIFYSSDGASWSSQHDIVDGYHSQSLQKISDNYRQGCKQSLYERDIMFMWPEGLATYYYNIYKFDPATGNCVSIYDDYLLYGNDNPSIHCFDSNFIWRERVSAPGEFEYTAATWLTSGASWTTPATPALLPTYTLGLPGYSIAWQRTTTGQPVLWNAGNADWEATGDGAVTSLSTGVRYGHGFFKLGGETFGVVRVGVSGSYYVIQRTPTLPDIVTNARFYQGIGGLTYRSELPFAGLTNPDCMVVRESGDVVAGSDQAGATMLARATAADTYATWPDITGSYPATDPVKAVREV